MLKFDVHPNSTQQYLIKKIDFRFVQLKLQAKKAAEDASKQALHASKQAAGVSKNTFEDLTYVGKSTIGDLTKTAKEAAAKKGLMKGDGSAQQQQLQQQYSPPPVQAPGTSLVAHGGGGIVAGTGKDFFSSFSSASINDIASSTTSMFSDFFGSKSKCRFRSQIQFNSKYI